MLQTNIQKIISDLKYKSFETLEGKITYTRNLTNTNLTYKSFKIENNILIITNEYELTEFFKKYVEVISLDNLLLLKNKSDIDFKRKIKKKIILMHDKDLGKIGLILSKFKKKPIYITNITEQINELLYKKNLKFEKNYVIFKICKLNKIDLNEILSKIENINELVLKSQPDIKYSKISLRTTMGKYNE